MASELTLHQRRRDPSPAELAGIPWLGVLQPTEREMAIAHIKVGDALPGAGNLLITVSPQFVGNAHSLVGTKGVSPQQIVATLRRRRLPSRVSVETS